MKNMSNDINSIGRRFDLSVYFDETTESAVNRWGEEIEKRIEAIALASGCEIADVIQMLADGLGA